MTLAALVLTAALAQAPGYYTRAEAEQMLSDANAAFARGDAVKAAEGYKRLAEHGFASADVLYNLGTAELQAGELGPAVLHLERAQRAGGARPDVEANLRLARSKLVDHAVGGGGGEGLWRRVAQATDRDAAAWALVASVGVACAFLIAARLLGGRAPRLRAMVALPLCVALPSACLLAIHARAEATDRQAVVMSPSLPARTLPDPSAKVLFELHPGLTVRVLEERAGLVKIRLPNDAEGWVDAGGVEQIDA